jgi:hypothetical protein
VSINIEIRLSIEIASAKFAQSIFSSAASFTLAAMCPTQLRNDALVSGTHCTK